MLLRTPDNFIPAWKSQHRSKHVISVKRNSLDGNLTDKKAKRSYLSYFAQLPRCTSPDPDRCVWPGRLTLDGIPSNQSSSDNARFVQECYALEKPAKSITKFVLVKSS